MEKEGESLPIKRGEGERKRRRNSGEGCGKANWKMEEKQSTKKRDGNKRQRRRVTEKRGSRVYFEK